MAGQTLQRNRGVMAVAAFAFGVVAGVFVKVALQRAQEMRQRWQTNREHQDTVVYDENLPEPLERREPAPHEGQPRYGGTGAIGFPPAAATPKS